MNAPLFFTAADSQAQISFGQRPWQLLLLSAKTATALDQSTRQMADYIRTHPALELADIAYTLQIGRRLFEHRRMLLCRDPQEAVQMLERQPDDRVFTVHHKGNVREPVLVFSADKKRGCDIRTLQQLSVWNSDFRTHVEQCMQQLPAALTQRLQRLLLTEHQQPVPARLSARMICAVQFIAQYALARLWLSWGIAPAAMVCPGAARYIAACVNGELTPAAALTAFDQEPLSMDTDADADADGTPEHDNGDKFLLPSLPAPGHHGDAVAWLLQTLGRLYCSGVPVDWRAVHGDQRPRRVALPTYPFERRRYWFGSAETGTDAGMHDTATQRSAQTFYARPDDLRHAYMPPRNPIEQTLADICRELLGFERIGMYDNIVELGADSLFTMQLSRKVEQLFQLSISPHHLFSEPTLGSLAEKLKAAGALPAGADDGRSGTGQSPLNDYLQILQSIEQMSDEQVDELLAKWSD